MGSAITGGRSRRHFFLDREAVGGGEMRQIRYGRINRIRHGDRARLILLVLVARGGEQQHLPNHGGKALGLIADERAILFHLSAGSHHTVGKIFRR